MAEDKKVFDIAPANTKPTSEKSNPDSKIIANGHDQAPVMATDQQSVAVEAGTPVMVRREKTIVPVAEEIDSSATPSSGSAERLPEPEGSSTASNVSGSETPSGTESAKFDDSGSRGAEDLQSLPGEVQQVPKIFDTTQYQLPIQRRHKGGVARFTIQFLVVSVLVGLVAVVLAADAGWIDIGIELPFNLL